MLKSCGVSWVGRCGLTTASTLAGVDRGVVVCSGLNKLSEDDEDEGEDEEDEGESV